MKSRQILGTDQISSEKISKLLAYLFLHHDRVLSQQELTDVLWEKNETDNPAGALKNLIYRTRILLKKKLGDSDYILTSRGSYNWNPDITLEIDAERFHLLIQNSKELEGAEKCEVMEDAIRLYKGKVLQNFGGEHWIVALGTYYQSLFLAATRSLAQEYYNLEHYADVVRICNLGLEQDTLDEELHSFLVKALLKQGKNNLAREHYDVAVKQLQDAFGISSLSSLKGLEKELMAAGNKENAKLSSIQEELDEDEYQGAFCCGYGVFQEIYHLEARRISRMGISEFILLFTLKNGENQLASEETQFHLMKKAVKQFMDLVQGSLRIGDVISQYSDFQVAVLLPASTYESAILVADRIIRRFGEEHKYKRFYVEYSIEEVTMAEPFV
ncbi:MAG: BTAD domain-containing putative transcriptional regulator [Lachnospiraceae bacterium]|nr:BTAD domain-containing putative transcriptional regulator [Lachnospiraceae bacterium]